MAISTLASDTGDIGMCGVRRPNLALVCAMRPAHTPFISPNTASQQLVFHAVGGIGGRRQRQSMTGMGWTTWWCWKWFVWRSFAVFGAQQLPRQLRMEQCFMPMPRTSGKSVSNNIVNCLQKCQSLTKDDLRSNDSKSYSAVFILSSVVYHAAWLIFYPVW